MHITATIVGLLTAGLIVFLVFGNASREGAVQDGEAPGVTNAAGTSLCGKVPAAELLTPANVAKAPDQLPTILDPTGRSITGLGTPTQQAWLNRLVAGAGFCLDEIALSGPGGTTSITLSTTDSVDAGEVAAFTGGALVAGHAAPFADRTLLVTTFAGDQKRTIKMTKRALDLFATWRQVNGAGSSVTDLVRFSRDVRPGAANLQILGWS